MVNCEVEVPDKTISAKSANRARSARSWMDLVATKQVEDPHVVYAVGDDEVDKEVGQEVVVRDKSSKGLVVLWWTEQ